jgi:hypothetical protein
MAYMTTGMLLLSLDPLCRVSSSANGIYALMSNINNFTSYPNVVIALKELDIEASIRILEKFLKELNIKHRTKTLEEALNLLKECIVNIENELSDIHNKMAENTTIAKIPIYNWYKSHKFSGSIVKLKMLRSQLDNRKDMLFNIMKTNSELETRHNKNIDPEMSLLE